eukprot:TRINITY_DN3326_c0_g1_i2.p1 TRINITY_DN3326_c0_g1~~TRINITY_DN3326_c0_g1_i2.p1  ORF type:complete len:284 (+),score=73.23 TRINITY_DN3326_c0_g1_i2:166-1017(+)
MNSSSLQHNMDHSDDGSNGDQQEREGLQDQNEVDCQAIPYDRRRMMNAIDEALSHDRGLDAAVREGMQFVKATALLVEQNGLEESLVDHCQDLLTKLVEAQLQQDAHVDAMKRLKQVVEDEMQNDRLLHDDQWLPGDHVSTLMNMEASAIEATKAQKLDAFRREIWAESHPDEPYPEDDENADLVEMGSANSQALFMCPLTRSLLVDPVKSSKCGHHYSKQAIMQYIHSKAQHRQPAVCPVSGCRQLVTSESLEPDVEAAFWLRRRRGESQEESPSEAVMDFT